MRPRPAIIILTTFEGDVEMQRALEAGARGYLLKSMPPKELVAAIRQVHAGRKSIPAEVASQLAEHLGEESLTAREIDVLSRVAGGNRNRDIAEQLVISEETVKVHMKHIMEKLGASDRTQAVAIALPPRHHRVVDGLASYHERGSRAFQAVGIRAAGLEPGTVACWRLPRRRRRPFCNACSPRFPRVGRGSASWCCGGHGSAPPSWPAVCVWRATLERPSSGSSLVASSPRAARHCSQDS